MLRTHGEGNPLSTFVGKHLVTGAWREGSDGFDLRQRIEPFQPLGTWPRAGEALVVEAIETSRSARDAWRALSAVERSDCLQRVLKHLREDSSWSDHLVQLLGLQSNELEAEFSALDALIAGDAPTTSSTASTGDVATEVGVVFARWTDLISGLFQRIVAQLDSERGVVLISDDRWPVSADALGAAFLAAGLPLGVVSILHGLSAPLRSTLLSVCDAGTSATDAAAALESEEPEPNPLLRASKVRFALDFGGVERGNSSFIVREETELGQAANQVIERAFGRADTFSGQRANRVARVICNVARFSAFCEHLVEALESSKDVSEPLPLIDGEAFKTARSLWNLGLDEGATLIFGGESFPSSAGSRSRDPRVWPAVFTNVDSEMALSRFRETAPVLCLIRAESDEAAEALARELD